MPYESSSTFARVNRVICGSTRSSVSARAATPVVIHDIYYSWYDLDPLFLLAVENNPVALQAPSPPTVAASPTQNFVSRSSARPHAALGCALGVFFVLIQFWKLRSTPMSGAATSDPPPSQFTPVRPQMVLL